MFKLIPLLCTHVYSYMFSIVHPPSTYIHKARVLRLLAMSIYYVIWNMEHTFDFSRMTFRGRKL